MNTNRLCLTLLCAMGISFTAAPDALAQDSAEAAPQEVQSAAPAAGLTVTEAYKEKIRLATKLHDYRPAQEVLDQIIDVLIARYPEDRRPKIKERLTEMIDIYRIREITIRTMADIYTKEELELMIQFYGAPEYKSIAEKTQVYIQLVQPEIVKQIDAALLKMRVGDTDAP